MKLSEKAQKFLKMDPCQICVVAGITFYEHPFLGEEAPLVYISKNGKVVSSNFREQPTLEELEFYGIV